MRKRKYSATTRPYKLARRQNQNRVIDIDGVKIGGQEFVVIAGPCAVENKKQYLTVARKVKELGAKILRGSVFKPRTSPYDFRGLLE